MLHRSWFNLNLATLMLDEKLSPTINSPTSRCHQHDCCGYPVKLFMKSHQNQIYPNNQPIWIPSSLRSRPDVGIHPTFLLLDPVSYMTCIISPKLHSANPSELLAYHLTFFLVNPNLTYILVLERIHPRRGHLPLIWVWGELFLRIPTEHLWKTVECSMPSLKQF